MAGGGYGIKLSTVGVSEFADRCMRVDDTFSDAMEPAARAIGRLVASAARARTPVLSGRLRGTVRAELADRTTGGVTWGTPYGGVIHFGWAGHNIAPQPFATDAANATQPQWEALINRAMMATLDQTAG